MVFVIFCRKVASFYWVPVPKETFVIRNFEESTYLLAEIFCEEQQISERSKFYTSEEEADLSFTCSMQIMSDNH